MAVDIMCSSVGGFSVPGPLHLPPRVQTLIFTCGADTTFRVYTESGRAIAERLMKNIAFLNNVLYGGSRDVEPIAIASRSCDRMR